MSKAHPTDMKKEYVALVTFGHQTKIQVGYTDNFMDIEKELGIVYFVIVFVF